MMKNRSHSRHSLKLRLSETTLSFSFSLLKDFVHMSMISIQDS